MASSKKPIAIKKAAQGSLRAATGTPKGSDIPASTLKAAASSPDPAMRKKAQFAINARKFNHTGTKKGK